MKLYKVDIECVDAIYSIDHLLDSLAWKSEYEVCADLDVSLLGGEDSLHRLCEIVASIYTHKSGVVDRLYAVLYSHEMLMRQMLQKVEFLGIDAVGACAYDNARYGRVG